MAIRYKTTSLNGKHILSHKKVWLLSGRTIPEGYCLHHIDENKFNNDINNLALMTKSLHAKHHWDIYYNRHPRTSTKTAKSKKICYRARNSSWNKGIKYGEHEGYKKSVITKKVNYDRKCKKNYRELKELRTTQAEYAKKLGISRRQLCDRLQRARQIIGV